MRCFALLCFALLCFALLWFALVCFALLCFVHACSSAYTNGLQWGDDPKYTKAIGALKHYTIYSVETGSCCTGTHTTCQHFFVSHLPYHYIQMHIASRSFGFWFGPLAFDGFCSIVHCPFDTLKPCTDCSFDFVHPSLCRPWLHLLRHQLLRPRRHVRLFVLLHFTLLIFFRTCSRTCSWHCGVHACSVHNKQMLTILVE